MSMKNPLRAAGIEPATFRFVAQHLNHCATAIKINIIIYVYTEIIISKFDCHFFKPLMLIEESGCSVAPELECTRLTYMRGFKVIDNVCITRRRDSRALAHAECGCSNYCIRAE